MNRVSTGGILKFKRYVKGVLLVFRFGGLMLDVVGKLFEVFGELFDLLSEEVDVALQFVVGRVITTSV